MTQTSGPFAAGQGANLGQDDYLDFLGPMLQGDGVATSTFGGPTLQVRGNSSGMQVLVGPGSAIIRGAMYHNDADIAVPISANTSGSQRTDRVVLRLDRNHAGGGQIAPVVVVGTPGSGPPALEQTPGGVWDIPLAQVNVAAAATGINPENVTDERQYMPLKVAVADSRVAATVPPADGSRGRIVYDKNPAFNNLAVTDGSTWRAVALVNDTGWVNLDWDSAQWATLAGQPGPQARVRNGVVDVRIALRTRQITDTVAVDVDGVRYSNGSQVFGSVVRVATLPPAMRSSPANGSISGVYPLDVYDLDFDSGVAAHWCQVHSTGEILFVTTSQYRFPAGSILRTAFTFLAG